MHPCHDNQVKNTYQLLQFHNYQPQNGRAARHLEKLRVICNRLEQEIRARDLLRARARARERASRQASS